jgi:Bacterial regulatory protein, Fis family
MDCVGFDGQRSVGDPATLIGRTLADVERDLILGTLRHCHGNRTHAANILGISLRTLRNKLNEYSAQGMPVPPPGGGTAREPRRPAGRCDLRTPSTVDMA